MDSTSTDADDSQNLFPTSTTSQFNPSSTIDPMLGSAHTPPPQNDHLNASAQGELSPPRSQNHSTTDLVHEAFQEKTLSVAGRKRRSDENGSGSGSGKETKPGDGWKSKRAQEEMQRAWDNVVDRDFNLMEFGDIMAQSQQQQR